MSSDQLLYEQSIRILASVPGVFMDPDALVEDVLLLGHVFSEKEDFQQAVYNTQQALVKLVSGTVTSSPLRGAHADWNSYHYQHTVRQGQQADMRIEWQPCEGGIRVRGFGHRWVPQDFYRRMSALRRRNDRS